MGSGADWCRPLLWQSSLKASRHSGGLRLLNRTVLQGAFAESSKVVQKAVEASAGRAVQAGTTLLEPSPGLLVTRVAALGYRSAQVRHDTITVFVWAT